MRKCLRKVQLPKSSTRRSNSFRKKRIRLVLKMIRLTIISKRCFSIFLKPKKYWFSGLGSHKMPLLTLIWIQLWLIPLQPMLICQKRRRRTIASRPSSTCSHLCSQRRCLDFCCPSSSWIKASTSLAQRFARSSSRTITSSRVWEGASWSWTSTSRQKPKSNVSRSPYKWRKKGKLSKK